MENFVNGNILKEVVKSQISIETIIIVLVIATILGFAVSITYRKTFQGASFSSFFSFSLVLLSVITAVVMLVVGSDLARAFGLVGALSIIRFRTAIKNPKDIVFIFLSLILGMAVGTQNYHIAILSALFIIILIHIMDRINYGLMINDQYFLNLDIKKDAFNESEIKPTLNRFTKAYSINSLNSVYNDDKIINVIYKVTISKNKESELLSALRKIDGIENVSFSSAENYINQ
jgi:uncharacterized membrane protein YhiD involved in acid resistance